MSATDTKDDEEWRFAPVGVLSHLERDVINVDQMYRFAKAFDLPLVRWKLEIDGIEGAGETEGLLGRLYEEERQLWGYFVPGAPVFLNQTIKATRRLVNGSEGLLHSLTFADGRVPNAITDIKGGFQVISLENSEAPVAVNVTVGSTKEKPHFWHGNSCLLYTSPSPRDS